MNEIHRMVWLKRNKELADRMEDYCKEYRKTVCEKCTAEIREQRNCRVYPSGKTYCNHMILSRTKKFGQTIVSEILLLARIESQKSTDKFIY